MILDFLPLTGFLVLILVLARPKAALWIGLAIPAVQTLYPTELLRTGGMLLMVMAIGAGWSSTTRRSRTVVQQLALFGAVVITMGWLLSTDRPQSTSAAMNLLYAVILAACAVVMKMSTRAVLVTTLCWAVPISAWLVQHDVVGEGRGGELFLQENANGLGAFAALGTAAAASLALGPLRRRSWLIALVVLALGVLGGYGIAAAGSRGAVLAVVFAVMVVLARPLVQRSRVGALALLAAFSVFLASASDELARRFLLAVGREEAVEGTLESRTEVLVATLRLAADNPLAGVGLSRVEDFVIVGSAGLSAHNAYVGLFAGAGVIAGVGLLLLLGSALVRARRWDYALLPSLVCVLLMGISLDWPTMARLGPLGFVLIAVAMSRRPDDSDSTDAPQPAPEGDGSRAQATRLRAGSLTGRSRRAPHAASARRA